MVGTAVDGQEAVEKALALSPDVVLMDVRMPVLDGIEATFQIRRKLPGCQVLMLTTFDDEEYVVKSLQAGATGYLLKDIPAADLAQAIHLVRAGIYQLIPPWPASWSDSWASKSAARPAGTAASGTRSDGARAGGAATACRRRHQSRDRRGACGERGHGEEPRLEHPQPAGAARPDPGRALRARARADVGRG